MSERAFAWPHKTAGSMNTSAPLPLLQRNCACGGTPGPDGECAAWRRKQLGLRPLPRIKLRPPRRRLLCTRCLARRVQRVTRRRTPYFINAKRIEDSDRYQISPTCSDELGGD